MAGRLTSDCWRKPQVFHYIPRLPWSKIGIRSAFLAKLQWALLPNPLKVLGQSYYGSWRSWPLRWPQIPCEEWNRLFARARVLPQYADHAFSHASQWQQPWRFHLDFRRRYSRAFELGDALLLTAQVQSQPWNRRVDEDRLPEGFWVYRPHSQGNSRLASQDLGKSEGYSWLPRSQDWFLARRSWLRDQELLCWRHEVLNSWHSLPWSILVHPIPVTQRPRVPWLCGDAAIALI